MVVYTGDNITLSQTIICMRGYDMPLFCTAKDIFQITPLMELWDGIGLHQ